jgi:hypothetical protein
MSSTKHVWCPRYHASDKAWFELYAHRVGNCIQRSDDKSTRHCLHSHPLRSPPLESSLSPLRYLFLIIYYIFLDKVYVSSWQA